MDVPPKSTSWWFAAGHWASKSVRPSLILSTLWETCPLTAKSETVVTPVQIWNFNHQCSQGWKKKSRDKNAGFKSHTFQERVLKKNRSLLYAFQNVCLCVWLIRHFSVMACVKQWQEITFAFTAAWTTPPFTSCLWFYLWPCLSVDTLIHGVSQTSVPRVLHRFTNTLTHTKIPTSTWRDFGLGAVIGTD